MIEAEGIRFVAEEWMRDFVGGVEIDVESYWGREGLVASHRDFGGGGC